MRAVSQVMAKAESTTTLTVKLNPVASGSEVTFNAIVKGQFGGTAAGSVTFYDGTAVLKKLR